MLYRPLHCVYVMLSEVEASISYALLRESAPADMLSAVIEYRDFQIPKKIQPLASGDAYTHSRRIRKSARTKKLLSYLYKRCFVGSENFRANERNASLLAGFSASAAENRHSQFVQANE